MISARLDNYVSCLLTQLPPLLPLNHLSHHCSRLLAMQLGEKTAGYLDNLYAAVVRPVVELNLLSFSETFGAFVLPHCVDAAKIKDDLKTMQMASMDRWAQFAQLAVPFPVDVRYRFLSELELRSLASLVGPAGIGYLVEDLIYHRGVLPAMGKMKTSLERSKSALNVGEVLGLGIRKTFRHTDWLDSRFLILRNHLFLPARYLL